MAPIPAQAVQCLDTRSMTFVQIEAEQSVMNRFIDKRLVFSTTNAGGHQGSQGLSSQREALNCARKCTENSSCNGFDIVASMSGNSPCTFFEFPNLPDQSLKVVLDQILKAHMCEPDWWSFHDKCYTFEMKKETWSNAEEICLQKGGHLVSINSDRENDFITALTMIHHQKGTVWIGGHHNGGNRSWTSGEPWAFEKFYPTEPGTDGACFSLYANTYMWFDESCSDMQAFVCEK
ncbi:snaclec botrocetin subunit beta-like isoform X2 [Dreissena polymorpha]|uniref:C-type lectin domain-containing protein n=1 Tax=Dreissena polymorpha TaxID=45954 RepID=A0A9D4DCC2_DREPO|nr:snaclec botrocetin subunit beta-like isoform X2 [Dreissena polymorpha]XP_052237279.1 snaclec botrocetin subunit beta-like isoform X2 [Dreissena polymorpha]KAH3746341.1 hypothetical protein DPMN_180748 [Dreissena polymorpha]